MDRDKSPLIKDVLKRSTVCLLGLPVDVIDMKGAMVRIKHSILTGERLLLSTPNLNFLIAAQRDSRFRDSVLRSDLSVADGVSLVLLGRLLGANLPERVTGSDLFERLAQESTAEPIKVFFFGGPPGAGQQASEQLRRHYSGMVCVGYHEAGFGDVESMSTPDVIDMINGSGAQFVVAALGAQKGQAWLMHNQHRLTAPVISHLGAVINFMAGNVRRSPRWLQKIGMEWVWRIIEEPVLWKRYWNDGWAFLSLLIKNAIPAALAERRWVQTRQPPARIVSDHCTPTTRTLALSGAWSHKDLHHVHEALKDLHHTEIRLNLAEVTWLDIHTIGLVTSLHGRLLAEKGTGVVLQNIPTALRKHLISAGVEYLMDAEPMDWIGAKA